MDRRRNEEVRGRFGLRKKTNVRVDRKVLKLFKHVERMVRSG